MDEIVSSLFTGQSLGLLHDTRKTREHVLPQLGPLPTFTPRFLMQNPSIYHLIHPLSSPNLPEAPHLCLLSFYLFVLLGWPCPLSSPRQPSRSSVPGGSQGREHASVAELTPEILEQLEVKHPRGPTTRFGQAVGPTPGQAREVDVILKALDAFKPDTVPGVSGWLVPLLKLASKRAPVLKFLQLLCASIANNTVLGRAMLGTSRLIPLKKEDGSVRRIAVGELIYRLCVKALIAAHFQTDFLPPFQLGIKSSGSVEPIVLD
ncbi:hypothetical protein L804_04788 [Cryptococcus deuterogattii 2001/935-1]|nr:hypothetical protein L804_04788 [Cryptococcus deuterogattii 2001/935-1]